MEENLPGFLNYHLSTPQKDDCSFVFETENGQKEKVGAKKQFLMSHSETFRQILEVSPLVEKDDVHLKDVKVDTFKNLLKCVYGGGDLVLSLMSLEELVDLLCVAEKYRVEDLKPKLVPLIADSLSVDQICNILSNPICLKNTELEGEIMDFVSINIEVMLKKKCFLQIMKPELVLWILQLPSLNVSEISLWEGLLEWAKKKFTTEDKTELRKHLEEYHKHIRFGSMTKVELCEKVVTSDILLPEQVIEIIKYSCAPPGTAIKLGSLIFNTEPRQKLLGKTKTFYVWNNVSNIGPVVRQKQSGIFEFCDFKYTIYMDIGNGNISFNLCSKNTKEVETRYRTYTNYTWTNPLECKVVLINHSGKGNVTRAFSYKGTPAFTSQGFHDFVELSKVVDPKNGFIKNNSITVMVDIKIKDIK